MKVRRHTYTDAEGKLRETARYYLVFAYPAKRRRRLPAFEDRAASRALARHVERLVEMRLSGDRPDAELTRAIETWPNSIKKALVRFGLLEARRLVASQPIEDLAADFERALLDRGRTAQHAKVTANRARRVLEGAGAAFLSEVDAHRIERFLAGEREGGLSIASSNHLLTAARGLCRWLVERGLLGADPTRSIKKPSADTDRRRERRVLQPDELRGLIDSAANGPDRFDLDGRTRAWIYRLAASTGLRANEIRSLRVRDFEDLNGPSPLVRLQAASSKRRRDDVVPLRPDLARALSGFLAGRGALERPFPVPHRSAEMVREDLEDVTVEREGKRVAVPHTDERGVVDFHALRHTFVTTLARGGVEPKVAQELARHSTITLTMDRYTHLRSGDVRRALDVLPDLCSDEPATMSATGTTDEARLGISLGIEAGVEWSPLESDRPSRHTEDRARVAEWQTRWIQNPLPARA